MGGINLTNFGKSRNEAEWDGRTAVLTHEGAKVSIAGEVLGREVEFDLAFQSGVVVGVGCGGGGLSWSLLLLLIIFLVVWVVAIVGEGGGGRG